MTDPIWPRYFPGGVTDANAEHALLRDPRGRMMAVGLDDGRVLWRSETPLLPLLLGTALAVGLAQSPPRVMALALEGANTGRAVWTSLPLAWPTWADLPDPGLVDKEIDAVWIGGDIGLHWRLRRLSAGGASPGPNRPPPEVAVGQCGIDSESGAVRPLSAWPTRPPGFAQTEAVPDPHVQAQAHVGAKRYRVVAMDSPSGLRTSLVAHDAEQGHLLWEQALGDAPRRPPTQPRPQVGNKAR